MQWAMTGAVYQTYTEGGGSFCLMHQLQCYLVKPERLSIHLKVT